MVTYRIKIHLTLPLLRVGAGLLDTFFFSVLVPLTVLDFYLEPIFQQKSLFMSLTHPHTFETCLLMPAGPMVGKWRHSLLIWFSLHQRQAISRTRLSKGSFPPPLISLIGVSCLSTFLFYPQVRFSVSGFTFCSIKEKYLGLSQSRSCSLLPGLNIRVLCCLVPSLPHEHSVRSVKSECKLPFWGYLQGFHSVMIAYSWALAIC